MDKLELKIPPPIVALLAGAVMWALSQLPPLLDVSTLIRVATALTIATPGGIFSLAGGIDIAKAKTTVNPMKPLAASFLVTTGIFRFTRNPMYVGLLFVVLAWAAYLCSFWALLLGPAGFVLYMNRFQIHPEERVLESLFPAEYTVYRSRVPRWL